MASGIKMTVTNVSEEAVWLNDIYSSLAAGASIEFVRSPADLTQMYGLQKLLADGKVTIAYEGAPELLDEYGNQWVAGGGGGGGGSSLTQVRWNAGGNVSVASSWTPILSAIPTPVGTNGSDWLLEFTCVVTGNGGNNGLFFFGVQLENENRGFTFLSSGPTSGLELPLAVRAVVTDVAEGTSIGAVSAYCSAGTNAECRNPILTITPVNVL